MVSRLMPSCVMISSWLPRQKHIMSPPQLSHFPSDLLPSSSPSSYLPPPVDTSGLFHFCPCFWSLSESPPSPHHITPHIFVPRAISLAPPACLSPPNLFAFTAAQLVDLPSPLHPCPCSPSQGLSPFSPLSLLVLPCWACPLTTCCPTQSYHHLPPPHPPYHHPLFPWCILSPVFLQATFSMAATALLKRASAVGSQ